jgi:murein DD-endopeptidase MepM/ murein hydrolase activator NlpD
MSVSAQRHVFGTRSEPHTIVIARGDKVRHWTVRPWMLASGASALALILIAGLGAGVFLFAGDSVVRALEWREQQTMVAYESRIADLRNQLDRLTTRQHVVRETVSAEVEKIVDRQVQLADRFDELAPLLLKAQESGLSTPAPTQGKGSKPSDEPTWKTGSLDRSLDEVRALPSSRVELADMAEDVIPLIRRSTDAVEAEQVAQVEELATRANTRAERISALLGSVGIDAGGSALSGVGGPYVPAGPSEGFSQSLAQLVTALDVLERLDAHVRSAPLADPMPTGTRSSPFGVRADPFFGREALHSGMDFAVSSGTPVHPTAPGKVTSAGDAGGYGLMVEVDHGNGMRTRYGHLSRIDVSVGDKLTVGSVLGAVGSTGRSTGPHLHYEVRVDNQPVDPEPFIRTGRRLAAL